MTTPAQEDFLVNVKGWHDVDGVHKAQCKDLADLYCLHLFGDWVNTIRPGNGKDVFNNASTKYFVKVANNQADPNQVPPRGAIVSWEGTKAVPEGHVNIFLGGNASRGDFVEQNGYTQKGVERNSYPWMLPGGARPIGWLVPILAAAKPAQVVVEAGDSLYSISRQFGVPLQGLVNANPQLKNPNVIHAGTVLNLP